MEHYVTRAIIIPEIIKKIMEKYNLTSEAAMESFYKSSTGAALADDETGLYGQSPLYIYGLFVEERERNKQV